MQQKRVYRSAIALLITVFFVMLISLSIGIGLKYVKESSSIMNSERFMLQSTLILEDFLKILKTLPELNEVKDTDSLAIFLAQASLLPFESNGVKVLIEIKSARAKVNPNTLNTTEKLNIFKSFLIRNMINSEYADMLHDLIGGLKEDNLYNTEIFNEHPYLFRDYITSDKHLLALNKVYRKKYHEDALKNVNMLNLFYTSKDKNSSIDLNYATPLVWQLITGCDVDRANTLNAGGYGAYTTANDLALSDDENATLNKFAVSFYKPIVEVKININQNDKDAVIKFEYDIEGKKGSNFVFKV